MAGYSPGVSSMHQYLAERSRRPDERFREALNIMMMMKQAKEQRSSREWEQGMAERQFGLGERRQGLAEEKFDIDKVYTQALTDKMMRPEQPSMSAQTQKIIEGVNLGVFKDPAAGFRELNKIETEAEKQKERQLKAREELIKKQEAAKKEADAEKKATLGRDNKIVDDVLESLNAVKTSFNNTIQLTSQEKDRPSLMSGERKQQVKNATAIQNYIDQLITNQFYPIKNKIETGEPLTSEERVLLQKLRSEIKKAKTGQLFKELVSKKKNASSTLPAEVKAYSEAHPDVPIEKVLQLYQQYKKQ